jgi:hypothetical protein
MAVFVVNSKINMRIGTNRPPPPTPAPAANMPPKNIIADPPSNYQIKSLI